MTAETIERITAKYAAKFADDPTRVDEAIYRAYVEELARDVAGTVYLTVRNAIEQVRPLQPTPEAIAELSARLDAFAVEVGCDFAIKTRESAFPNGPCGARSDVERFAAQAYWTELQILLATIDRVGGSA